MSEKEKVLIITDKTEAIQTIANSIEKALAAYEVKVCSADVFEGTDILPVGLFFIGCESPSPASFAYLEELLKHISIPSRSCGIFSTNKEALEYLSGILAYCDAKVREPLLVSPNSTPDIEKQIKAIIK